MNNIYKLLIRFRQLFRRRNRSRENLSSKTKTPKANSELNRNTDSKEIHSKSVTSITEIAGPSNSEQSNEINSRAGSEKNLSNTIDTEQEDYEMNQAVRRNSYRPSTYAKRNKGRGTTFFSDENGENTGIPHIDDALREIGFGWMQWWIFVTAGFMLMSFVCETMGMSILSIAVKCDLNMQKYQVANLRTAAFIGVICSSFLWGYLSDHFGRRRILEISIGCAVLCSLGSVFCNLYELYYVMRFLTGFFMAGPSFIAMVYMIEFIPPEKRAKIINYMYVFNGIGMIYAPGTAHFIARFTWKYYMAPNYYFRPWRLLGIVFALPGFVAFLLLLRLPETPYYYLSIGNDEKAFEILNKISVFNSRRTLESRNIVGVGGVRRHSKIQTKWWQVLGFYEVFEGTSAKLILTTLLLIFGMFIICFGVGIWFTDLRNRAGPIQEETAVCSKLQKSFKQGQCDDSFYSFRDSLLLGVSYLVAYNIFGFFLICWSRRTVFIIALTTSGICGIMLPDLKDQVAVVIVFVWFISAPGAVNNLLGSAIVEYMPTHIRSRALCFCFMVGRIGVVLSIFLLDMLLENYCAFVFRIFGIFAICCAGLALLSPF